MAIKYSAVCKPSGTIMQGEERWTFHGFQSMPIDGYASASLMMQVNDQYLHTMLFALLQISHNLLPDDEQLHASTQIPSGELTV